jgi:hypothetical protein
MNLKKVLLGAGTAAVLLGSMIAPAFAAGSGDGSHSSACGAAHGAFADVNGDFGWLGAMGGTPGYHGGLIGQEPGATGYNNSHTGCHG